MTYLRTTLGSTTVFCLLLAPLLTAAEPAEELSRDYNVTPCRSTRFMSMTLSGRRGWKPAAT